MFFKNELKKRIKNEKGLTLIELLAVIVILAIIAAIAIPAIGNIINNSRDKAVMSDIQAAISAAKIAKADGTCTTSCTGAQFEFKSDKIADLASPATGENITITFGTDGSASVEAVLAKKLSGTRISDAIGKAGTGNSYTEGTLTVKVTESGLNKVLDGN